MCVSHHFILQALDHPLGFARYECYYDNYDMAVYESCTGWFIFNDGGNINFGTVVDDDNNHVTSTVYGTDKKFPKPSAFSQVSYTYDVSSLCSSDFLTCIVL